MNFQHFKEFKDFQSPYNFRYFESRVKEEDTPVDVVQDLQQKYEELDLMFEEFFDENSLHFAKHSSKEERDKRGLEDSSFVYGEIGVGRGIIAATLIHKFEKYVGIEYLENLHLFGLEVIKDYSDKSEKMFSEAAHLLPGSSTPQIELINDDFLKRDWSESSVVFANSTCFSSELMLSLSKKADELKKGTFFVTFTKKLPELSENWQICDGFRRLMSWGIATVYIHRKIL